MLNEYIFRTELNVTLLISLLFFQIGQHCATGGKSLHFSSCHQVTRDFSDTTHNPSSPRGPQRHEHGHDFSSIYQQPSEQNGHENFK